MAERSVPEIMNKRGQDGDFSSMAIKVILQTPYDIDKFSRHMKHSYGVCKTSVRGAWKCEFGNAKLPDAPQSLKFPRVNNSPSCLVTPPIVTFI